MRSCAVAVGVVLVGCVEVQPPGELVGAYLVTGTLVENTCGEEALPTVDPMMFEVQLRDDEGRGLWLVSPPARPGRLDEDGAFSFEYERGFTITGGAPPEITIETDPTVLVDPERIEREQMREPCEILVGESIVGSLEHAPAEDEAALLASNEIAVRVATGARCDALLVDAGGPWERLPCRALYDLEGEPAEP